jgi:hypothetical protein
MITSEQFPDDPNNLPPARRRRAHRLLAPLDTDERASFLDELAHRASPSFDFFVFSFLAGLVISAGLLLDAPALLLLGALLTPLMAPSVGVSLGTVTGSINYFFRSLAGLSVGSALVFLTGMAGGFFARFISQLWTPLALAQAHFYAQLSWANFLVLALGAGWTCAAMVKNDRLPAIPSVALAYELYLPLAAAGFGLAAGSPHLWPDGLVVFAVYLAWSALTGAIVLAVLGFRPLTLFGYTLGGVVTLLGVILIIGISGAGAVFGGNIALPTPLPTPTRTMTPTVTPSPTPIPPTATFTPTYTLAPTSTKTNTPIPSPTAMFALVAATGSDGVFLRADPGGAILKSYVNGTLVQLLPETKQQDGTTWVHVIAPDGQEGWVMQSLLSTPPTTPTSTPGG